MSHYRCNVVLYKFIGVHARYWTCMDNQVPIADSCAEISIGIRWWICCLLLKCSLTSFAPLFTIETQMEIYAADAQLENDQLLAQRDFHSGYNDKFWRNGSLPNQPRQTRRSALWQRITRSSVSRIRNSKAIEARSREWSSEAGNGCIN